MTNGVGVVSRLTALFSDVASALADGNEAIFGTPTQFLAKPFGLARLLAEMRQALSQHRMPNAFSV
jgi:hypothetical protein